MSLRGEPAAAVQHGDMLPPLRWLTKTVGRCGPAVGGGAAIQYFCRLNWVSRVYLLTDDIMAPARLGCV
jgi:hypothetical protein